MGHAYCCVSHRSVEKMEGEDGRGHQYIEVGPLFNNLALSQGQPFTSSQLFDPSRNRLVGLVVKASASRAEDPGFESHLGVDFFGVESYQ